MTAVEATPVAPSLRLKLAVRGAVQGVGFRPFVFRLATELGLTGWVSNSPQGVSAELEGPCANLQEFLSRLSSDKPPRSSIQSLETSWLDAIGLDRFEIRESEAGGDKRTLVLPDIATCPDCLREIFDPANRRYQYPFTNCTNCGPRFSIIEALPYDRANTSMRAFTMCPACQAEYVNPRNRRFHAQPNACPMCGPRLEFWQRKTGDACPTDNEALLAAAEAIRRGQIVAVKGIGGFHLLVDARNDEAVRRLRERKHREEKPLALMFPSFASVKTVCIVSPLEERLLCSPEAPIVLLRRVNASPHPGPLPQERENGSDVTGEFECSPFIAPPDAKPSESEILRRMDEFQTSADSRSLSPGERVRVRASDEQTHFRLAPSIAPGNPNLGVMLPSNPLHHLLMAELGFPVIATSGNLSDEPICTDEFEALERLHGIADVFLVHNRPIVRHMDDSIVRAMVGREMMLRRARGYAPLPVPIGTRSTASRTSPPDGDAVERVPTVLAVGAHLKISVALAVGDQVFISQHIGDLETEQANNAFRRVAADLPRLYDARPEVIAADLHPDYLSTMYAKETSWTASAERSGDGAFEAAGPTAENSKAVSRVVCHRSPQIFGVQHHVAHILSCIAENEVALPVLGVAWDGTGYGTDGTIWGGEFFLVTNDKVERVAQLRPFRLPGGDAAVKEPRRAALGLLHEMFGEVVSDRKDLPTIAAFTGAELQSLQTMLKRGLNAPFTSSMGRLFDAVASLTDLRQKMRFEGQAAMELEFELNNASTDEAYDLPLITSRAPIVLDWAQTVAGVMAAVQSGVSLAEISAKFHNALVEAMVRVAKHFDCPRVALSGGCFQNRYLTERAVARLREERFQPYWHQRVPPNDGGIALGQIVAARRSMNRSRNTQHATR